MLGPVCAGHEFLSGAAYGPLPPPTSIVQMVESRPRSLPRSPSLSGPSVGLREVPPAGVEPADRLVSKCRTATTGQADSPPVSCRQSCGAFLLTIKPLSSPSGQGRPNEPWGRATAPCVLQSASSTAWKNPSAAQS